MLILKTCSQRLRRRARQAGMTMAEVVIALAIAGIAIGAIFNGYHFAVISAEKSALSLVAQTRASEQLEELRVAKWDTASYPVIDTLVSTNFTNQVFTLALSAAGSNAISATNFIQISQVATNPPLRRIRVDTVWRFKNSVLMTNTVDSLRAPDQ